MLNDLKVCWKWKNADTICFKLASLISLEQGNVKNPKNWCKSMKIAKHKKSSYILNNFRNFKNVFRKDVIYDNINKSGGFHPLFRTYPTLATFLGLRYFVGMFYKVPILEKFKLALEFFTWALLTSEKWKFGVIVIVLRIFFTLG